MVGCIRLHFLFGTGCNHWATDWQDYKLEARAYFLPDFRLCSASTRRSNFYQCGNRIPPIIINNGDHFTKTSSIKFQHFNVNINKIIGFDFYKTYNQLFNILTVQRGKAERRKNIKKYLYRKNLIHLCLHDKKFGDEHSM